MIVLTTDAAADEKMDTKQRNRFNMAVKPLHAVASTKLWHNVLILQQNELKIADTIREHASSHAKSHLFGSWIGARLHKVW